MDVDRIVAELCASQQGVASRSQLIELGVDHHKIRARIRRGQLEAVTGRVIRQAGSPATDAQRLMVAVLDTGPDGIVSHETAAWWWGITERPIDRITVAVERDRRPSGRLVCDVRLATVIPHEHRKTHLGVPIASPALTLFQLAGSVSAGRLAALVDRAWSMRLTSGDELTRLLDRLAQRGRNGIRRMREVLRERGPEYVPPQSNLEARVLEVLRGASLDVRPQVDLGRETWTGRVDFVVEDRLVVEVQSERYHSSLSDRARDEARRSELELAGFVVVEVWDRDVFHSPWTVSDRVREELKAARAGSRASRVR